MADAIRAVLHASHISIFSRIYAFDIICIPGNFFTGEHFKKEFRSDSNFSHGKEKTNTII